MSITVQKIIGALLLTLIIVMGLNLLVNGIFGIQEAPAPAPQTASNAAPPASAPAAAATPAGPEKPLAERLAAADVTRGQATAKKCQSCHTFDAGGGTKVGPNLHGVAGRPKGSVSGFAYSDAVKGLGGSWTDADLDTFLTKPSAFAKGTKMTFAGLPDGQDRADVIAYLHSISQPGK